MTGEVLGPGTAKSSVNGLGGQAEPRVPVPEPGQRPPPPPGDANAGLRFRPALEALRSVVAPTTLLGALLFYFGWVFTNARSLYFGIDPSTLGLSNQDYLLRSIDPVFLPLGALLLIGLVLVGVHRALERALECPDSGRFLTPLVAVLALIGSVLFAVGLAGVANRPLFGIDFLLTPASLGLGLACASYAVHLRRRRLSPAGTRSSVAPVLVAMLVVLSLFWATGDWAQAVGRGRARQLAQGLGQRPGVVVYSDSPLHLDAPGVTETVLGGPAPVYRYQGLKLLIRSGGKFFLLPAGWTPLDGETIVLSDRDDLRLEFMPR